MLRSTEWHWNMIHHTRSAEKRHKILVIEDSRSLLNDVIDILNLEGFDTCQAENGKAGLEAVADYKPDLIICDVWMPIMDGYDVLSTLRADPATVNTPFIFLTASTSRKDVRHGMALGAADYLTKPFTAEELVNAVTTQLAKAASLEAALQDRMERLRHNIMLALPHELRTPLNTILGFSEILMTDTAHMDTNQVFDTAVHIHKAGQRLYRLVENYLIYTNLEVLDNDPERKKTFKQGYTRYPYAIVTQQSKEVSRTYGREYDLELIMKTMDQSVAIQDAHLSRIIHELVDNAFKFSHAGSIVRIGLEDNPEYLQISITDQGDGMSQAEIAAIDAYIQFKRDFREQQGVGLGLIIVKRMVELHGGSFAIDSELDTSTTVTFTLPLAQSAPA